MIKLFDSDEKLFNHNGIKILKPLKCILFKEDNGDYYIQLEDNVNNIEYYQSGRIITCPTPFPEGQQAFRIINVDKNTLKVSVKAKHVYFDSGNYIIKDNYIDNKNCNYALDYLNSNTDVKSPFTTSSNIMTNNSYRCIRKTLEEAVATIIEKWGGHLVRDNFKISVNSTIGEDRGITLKYGKNISSLQIEEKWEEVVTKILPVGKDGLLLPEVYLEIEQKLYDIPYTKVVSFEQNIEQGEEEDENMYNERLVQDLRSQALVFLDENKYPKVNYSLSANLDLITDVGDTIYVDHPKLNVSLQTNVISVQYDVILKRYKNIEFGNFRKTLKNLMNEVSKKVEDVTKDITSDISSNLDRQLQEATSKIWNVLGNSYVIYEGDKILVVDALPKEEAQNVMIINAGGIGFSQNGINGTFKSAWTIDGTLNMQNINVINLVADLIKGGTLKLGGSNNSNGCIEIYDESGNEIGRIDKNGFSLEITSGLKNISDFIDEVDDSINKLDTTVENNRQELLKKFDGYVPTSDLVQLEQKVQSIQTDTYTKTEINTKLIDGSVKKVSTTSCTFDENGMHYEKSNAPTSSTINHLGVDVKSTENIQSLLFAGYDEEINESIVKTENLTVNKYFVCGNSRIENYGTGGGMFVL